MQLRSLHNGLVLKSAIKFSFEICYSYHVMWNTKWMALQDQETTIFFVESDCNNLSGEYLHYIPRDDSEQ